MTKEQAKKIDIYHLDQFICMFESAPKWGELFNMSQQIEAIKKGWGGNF